MIAICAQIRFLLSGLNKRNHFRTFSRYTQLFVIVIIQNVKNNRSYTKSSHIQYEKRRIVSVWIRLGLILRITQCTGPNWKVNGSTSGRVCS